eukprot:scaffold16424_cov61-Phaeocystis_antarctica.AAC.2
MHSLRARQPRHTPFRCTHPPTPPVAWHLLPATNALDGDCALELLHLLSCGRGGAPPHARAGELDPPHPREARGPLPQRPRLLGHLLLELAHALGQVVPPQPLVTEGERRQPNGHVGVRVLGGLAWHGEARARGWWRRPRRASRGSRAAGLWGCGAAGLRGCEAEGWRGEVRLSWRGGRAHGKQRAVARHRRVARVRALELLGLQQPVVYAVDARERVRQQRIEPVRSQVEQLHLAVAEARHDRDGRRRAREGVGADLHVAQPAAGLQPRPQPEDGPLGEERLELLPVPRGGEQQQVRRRLQHVRGHALGHLGLERGARGACHRVGLEAAAAAAVAAEQPVEQEPRQLPAEARAAALGHVERHLVAERPVELRLERVQHEVDLVNEQHGAAEEAEHLDAPRGLLAQRGHRAHVEGRARAAELAQHALASVEDHAHALGDLAGDRGGGGRFDLPRVRQQVEGLDELERERLERGRVADHHRARVARLAQLGAQPRRVPRVAQPVEGERVHGLDEHAREDGAHHRAAHLEQRRGHALHHELRAVAEEQREQRRDHGGLAAAHDHLLAARAAALGRLDEAAHQRHLRLSQQEARHELERREARVEARAAVVAAAIAAARLLHKVAARRERGGEAVGLHSELELQRAPLRCVGRVPLPRLDLLDLGQQPVDHREAAHGLAHPARHEHRARGEVEHTPRLHLAQVRVEATQRRLGVRRHAERHEQLEPHAWLRARHHTERVGEQRAPLFLAAPADLLLLLPRVEPAEHPAAAAA